MRRTGPLRRRDERGVVAIALALISCFVMIPVAALAVDIGVQRVARSDMQSVADVVALDLARKLDGTTTVAEWEMRSPSIQDLADASRDRNSANVGRVATVVATLGRLKADGTFEALEADSDDVPSAVKVSASTSVDFFLMGGSGGAVREAVAQAASTACFKLGSYAARVKSADAALLSPLNDILGANLTLAGYQGLAGADITLADLAATALAGSPEELLTASISYADLLAAVIEVLNRENDPANAVAISALSSLLSVSAGVPQLVLGDVLHVDPDDAAALATGFNVLDLVTGAVLVANGGHAVEIPNLWANVAGTGSTKISNLSIIQGAATACGRAGSADAVAESAQLAGTVEFEAMNSPSINLPGLANFKTEPATGTLSVSLANARGELAGSPPVHCGSGTPEDPTKMRVNVSSELSTIDLTARLPLSGTVDIGLGLFGFPLLSAKVELDLVINVNVHSGGSASAVPVDLSIPPNDEVPVSTGSPVRLDTANVTAMVDTARSVATVKVGALGVLDTGPLSIGSPLLTSTLNHVLDAVTNGPQSFVGKTIAPLASNVNDMLLGPLGELLGLDIAGADVYGVNAVCNLPKLAG